MMNYEEIYNARKISEFKEMVAGHVGQMKRDLRNGVDSSHTIAGCLMCADIIGGKYGKSADELKEMVHQMFGF